MSNETNEILTIAGKRVVVKYVDKERYCCNKCCFGIDDLCSAYNKNSRNSWPCDDFFGDGKRAYFVPAENTEADLEAEAERFLKTLPWRTNTPPIPDEYLDEKTYLAIARHFAEWGAARLLAGAIKTDIFDIEDGSDAAKLIVSIPGAKTGDGVYIIKEEGK